MIHTLYYELADTRLYVRNERKINCSYRPSDEWDRQMLIQLTNNVKNIISSTFAILSRCQCLLEICQKEVVSIDWRVLS